MQLQAHLRGATEVVHRVVNLPHLHVGLFEQALVQRAVAAGDLLGLDERLLVFVRGLLGEAEVFVNVADVLERLAGLERGFELQLLVVDFRVGDLQRIQVALDHFGNRFATDGLGVEADLVQILDFQNVADLCHDGSGVRDITLTPHLDDSNENARVNCCTNGGGLSGLFDELHLLLVNGLENRLGLLQRFERGGDVAGGLLRLLAVGVLRDHALGADDDFDLIGLARDVAVGILHEEERRLVEHHRAHHLGERAVHDLHARVADGLDFLRANNVQFGFGGLLVGVGDLDFVRADELHDAVTGLGVAELRAEAAHEDGRAGRDGEAGDGLLVARRGLDDDDHAGLAGLGGEVLVINLYEEALASVELLGLLRLRVNRGADVLEGLDGVGIAAHLEVRLADVVIGVVRVRRAGMLLDDLAQLAEGLLELAHLEEADAHLKAGVTALVLVLVVLDGHAAELVEREVELLLPEELLAHFEPREEAPAGDGVAVHDGLVEVQRGGQLTRLEARVTRLNECLGLLVIHQRQRAAASGGGLSEDQWLTEEQHRDCRRKKQILHET